MNSSISDAPLDDSVPEDIEMQNFMKLLNPNMSSLIHDMLDAPLTSDEIAQLKRVPRKLINKTESTKNEDIKVNSQPEDLIHLADQGAVLSTQPLRPSFKSVNPKIALARGMISEPLSDENVELNRGDEMREVNKTDSTKNDDIKMNSSISDARSDDGIPEDTEMQNFMKLLNPKMSSLIHNMLDAPLTSDEIAQLKRVPRELINKTESTENEDFKVNLQPEDLLYSAFQEAVPSTQPLRASFKSVNPEMIALARGMISEPLSDENVELNRGDEMREVNKTESTKNDDIKMNSSISDARADDSIPEDAEMQNFMKLLNPKMSSLIHNMLDAPLTSDEIAQLKRVPRELINKTESTENEDFKVNLQPEDLLHSADQEAVPSTQPLPPSTPLTPGRAKLKAWLYRTMRILMSDGRILVGAFLCTDSNANVILGMCSESHELGGEERALGLVMVPGKHIVKMEVDSSNEFV